MKLFSEGVRVEIGKTSNQTKITDLATGELVENLIGMAMEIDGNNRTDRPVLILVIGDVDMTVENDRVDYQVDAGLLQRIAEFNGFDLVPKPEPVADVEDDEPELVAASVSTEVIKPDLVEELETIPSLRNDAVQVSAATEHQAGQPVGRGTNILKGGIGGLSEDLGTDEIPRSLDTSDPV
ncbi:hypothetical protein CPT_Sansa13 [Caulobacter phage Sansa]|uniref:Uncharacterized protein n=1 Tax=Caulobacter phage Sansa TaxID=1675600 RepID=A0A0K1LLP1_9CAUD|nr:hypothetical protein HOR07_gp013 [Caulobacter phage Sansa]AKU43417.1 hypothetical protein CPT_Sansa13 [Caulobacter phage Sansa]